MTGSQMTLDFSQVLQLIQAIHEMKPEDMLRRYLAQQQEGPSAPAPAYRHSDTIAAGIGEIHRAVVLPRDKLATSAHLGRVKKDLKAHIDEVAAQLSAQIEQKLGAALLHMYRPSSPVDPPVQELIDAGYDEETVRRLLADGYRITKGGTTP